MANKENLPPRLATPPISRLSPSHKPALGRQRDHSGCRVADSPLKVKKTRENLKQASNYAEVPPPCSHAPHATPATDRSQHHTVSENSASLANGSSTLSVQQNPENAISQPLGLSELPHSSLQTPSKIQRQKSVSRRMLSRVKQGITNKSKSSQSIRPTGSETSLVRRLSGRRKLSSDADHRSHSFELSRDSIESTIEEISGLSAETAAAAQRSFTDSTVSTSEILEDLASVRVSSYRAGAATEPRPSTIESSSNGESSSQSAQPTPRLLKKSFGPAVRLDHRFSVAVPCVDLAVSIDSTSVDVNSRRDVWAVLDATVRLKNIKLTSDSSNAFSEEQRCSRMHAFRPDESDTGDQKYTCGMITNLRLCYKPAEGCRIRNIIGQKSYRDLVVGQRCTLFIKLMVPKMQRADNVEKDQDSLFAELESMVGTLETDIMHVEARYRHSLLPSDNLVALKHTCKILRPKTESRWSIIGLYEKAEGSSDVHVRLAQYLADHNTAVEALELLHRYFDYDTRARTGLAEICSQLQNTINIQRNGLEDRQPEVVVTDIDFPAESIMPEQFNTAQSTPVESKTPTTATAMAKSYTSTDSPSSHRSSTLAPPRISAPRTTTAIATSALASSSPAGVDVHESHDSAHQLWRHIRRTSLSTRQLDEMTPDCLSSLEAGDDSLKERRRRAIANKRSIGAETLRIWKWEEDMQERERPAEAPWM